MKLRLGAVDFSPHAIKRLRQRSGLRVHQVMNKIRAEAKPLPRHYSFRRAGTWSGPLRMDVNARQNRRAVYVPSEQIICQLALEDDRAVVITIIDYEEIILF